jgi:hypothetical protein
MSDKASPSNVGAVVSVRGSVADVIFDFGAHTYERLDAKGAFHTEWEKS